jgi:hypothetical protein
VKLREVLLLPVFVPTAVPQFAMPFTLVPVPATVSFASPAGHNPVATVVLVFFQLWGSYLPSC